MIVRNLKSLAAIPTKELLERRYQKFRRIGEFEEQAGTEPATPVAMPV